MTLAVLKFIEENQTTWREKLAEKPYSITIKDDGNYTILSYSQIHSDFKEQICRECRGLIIKAAVKGFCCVRDDYQGGFPLHCTPDIKYIPVCVGFYKFGNYGQDYCPEIDWPSARVQEKLDGSLIRVWFDADTWHISTNNVIDAGKASTHADDYTFEQLFKNALHRVSYRADLINHDKPKSERYWKPTLMVRCWLNGEDASVESVAGIKRGPWGGVLWSERIEEPKIPRTYWKRIKAANRQHGYK